VIVASQPMGEMMRLLHAILASSMLLTVSALAAPPAKKAADKPAAETLAPLPVPEVAYTKTVLKNGLTLIVHEDHKAPIVAVNVWYHVGSKNEPAGRTGFAHLFEHLMFGGKNGNQKGWFEKMEAMGATNLNGTTNSDRTNFFENVPVGALDATLYLEAQRMGHLLDDFNADVLTTQRGVVQNEKRQGDNQPYRISEDLITKSIWPAGHPYSHTVIGEMADLDAAKIEDVKDWFAKYYGPSNAILAIAGDITPAEAKAKVEKYFGAIPPGPPVPRQKAWVAKRTGSQRAVAQDRVKLARLYKVWNVPGYGTDDGAYLDLLATVAAGGKDSRFYRRLVLNDKIAADVMVHNRTPELAGEFRIQVTANPGVGLDRIEAVCNEEMAKLLRDGPTAAELERARTRMLSSMIRNMERVGGFGGTSDLLAQSEAFSGSPDAWKKDVARYRSATPAQVKDAARRWLSDGDFTLEILPFGKYAASGTPVTALPEATATVSKGFGKLERAKLSNGITVMLVERHATPTVSVALTLDAGHASDPAGKSGTAALTTTLLSDGTPELDAVALGERMGVLGAEFGAHVSQDFIGMRMNAFTARLDPTLALFADIVRHPAFRAEDVAREKALTITHIQMAKDRPDTTASRLMAPLVYGSTHAYGGMATEAGVAALTVEDLRRYHDAWFQPKGATLVVVGDTTMKEILPKLEAQFGAWKAVAHPEKNLAVVTPPIAPVVYLVDKPGAVQSVIMAAETAPPRVNPDDIAIEAMNAVFGGTFTSRLNMNLREGKHWSYGARSFVQDTRGPGLFGSHAQVQADKTADSFVEMQKEANEILAARPVSAEELALAQNHMTHSLPGRWETNEAILSSVDEIAEFGLPDDYFNTYADKVRALGLADVARAAKTVVRPNAMVWIIVGDRASVEPALKAKGVTPVVIDADGKPVK
jgi:zinc protease